MSRIAGATQIAFATTGIDFTNNAAANKRAVSTLFYDADKLVSDRSLETRIPTRDLQIGIADPRQRHTHERLVSTLWLLDVFNGKFFSINSKGKHSFSHKKHKVLKPQKAQKHKIIWSEPLD